MAILGRRGVTARRRECLAALAGAVDAAGGPVHYSAVAGPLGISAWTAYDLLRELEAAGLAAARYAHRPGVAVGRTQVAFAPTAAGRQLLRDGAAASAPSAGALEERRLRRALSRATGGLPSLGRSADIAGHLGFWLAQAESLPGRSREGLRQLLGTAPEAATALSVFVAAVYGNLAARSAEQAEELTAAVSAFQQRLGRTTAARRERLARSLATLLDTLGPAAPAARPAPAGPAPG